VWVSVARPERWRPEDRDQVRGGLQERLAPVGAERRERLEPLRRHAALVAFLLLRFGGDANFLLDLGIRHDDEAPGLAVGAGRGGCRREDRVSNEGERDRPQREVPDGPARRETGEELL